jgi:hypothetical protein
MLPADAAGLEFPGRGEEGGGNADGGGDADGAGGGEGAWAFRVVAGAPALGRVAFGAAAGPWAWASRA